MTISVKNVEEYQKRLKNTSRELKANILHGECSMISHQIKGMTKLPTSDSILIQKRYTLLAVEYAASAICIPLKNYPRQSIPISN